MGRIDQTWYVAFTGPETAEDDLLRYRIFKRDFRHCYCFRQDGDRVLEVDPTITGVDVDARGGYTAEQYFEALKKRGDTVIPYKRGLDKSKLMFNFWNFAPTCVTVVKVVLGISAKAQTPYQLYKYLLKREQNTNIKS